MKTLFTTKPRTMQKAIYNLALCLTLLVSVTASAQQVSWKSKVEPIEGDTYRIVLEAVIPDGYHMYDMGPYTDGPNATVIEFIPGRGVSLEGEIVSSPEPHRYFNEIYGMQIGTYSNRVRFTQRVRLLVPRARIEWMICNDQSCMPPEDTELNIPVPPRPATTKTAGATRPK